MTSTEIRQALLAELANVVEAAKGRAERELGPLHQDYLRLVNTLESHRALDGTGAPVPHCACGFGDWLLRLVHGLGGRRL